MLKKQLLRLESRIALLSMIFIHATGMTETMHGTIQGVLIDAETKSPLMGGNVILLNTSLGSATDENGQFKIADVPIGNYTLKLTYIGYKSVIKPDVIVKPDRITFVRAETRMATLEMEAISVSAGYFSETNDQAASAIGFSYEEIRRAPTT
jgi:hypothetical protein